MTIRVAVAGKALGAGLSGSAHGQDAAPPSQPTTGTTTIQELAKSLHSPFEDFVKLPVQATSAFGLGAQHDVGEGVNGAALLPVPLSAQWGLIALPSLTAVYLPRSRPQFGLGDLQASFFMTPHADTTWIWGAGPILQLPTATSPDLGTGRWSAGPTAALVHSKGPWFNAPVAYQLMSVAGARDRGSIS